ncbi:MAG: hypothetical protein GY750_21050 [Lentisphaerae bacterium]|nr:hypothetical protein [Lentisphaerota bacterium]
MAYKKKTDDSPKKEKKNAKKQCPYCKSEALKEIKKTEIGALYSCGCGNHCQL